MAKPARLLLIAAILATSVGAGADLMVVRLGGGCVGVPTTYRVVMTDHMIDQIYGFIDAPGQPRVLWSTGLGEGQPRCLSACKVVQRGRESIGSTEWRLGVIQEEGTTALFLALDFVGFRADGDSEATLNHLRSIAASYSRRDEPWNCQHPEDKSEQAAF